MLGPVEVPPGSEVPYSARDDNGVPVPWPGTPPGEAGLFRNDAWPPGYYKNQAGDIYFQDEQGAYHRKTQEDMDAAQKDAPAPEGAPPPVPAEAPPAADDAATPPGSKVPYSGKDAEDHAVPPPGTSPEDAGMVKVGSDPAGGQAGFFRGPGGQLYHLDSEGQWSLQQGKSGSFPPRPPGSEVVYREFDEHNNFMPPAGTAPEDAGLTYIGDYQGHPAYTREDSLGVYYQTPDGKWHRAETSAQ